MKIKGQKNIKQYGSDELVINNPLKLPDVNIIEKYYEPIVNATIITQDTYLSAINQLCMERRGELINSHYIDSQRLLINYKFPLSEVIIDFCDKLKQITSGYASFDYEDAGYRETKLVRLDILLNDKSVEELTTIVQISRAKQIGQDICAKLKETLPRQQFAVKGSDCVKRFCD